MLGFALVLFNLLAEAWFVNILAMLGTTIIGFLSFLLTQWMKKIAKKADNELLVQALEIVQRLIINVVNTVQQTFVEQLKKDGKFDKEAQAVALQKAIDQVIAGTSKEAQALITAAYGDFVKWVTLQIESLVYTEMPHSRNVNSVSK